MLYIGHHATDKIDHLDVRIVATVLPFDYLLWSCPLSIEDHS
jgi:hypothetical protein